MCRSADTRCAMSAPGNSGARSAGPTGWRVPGWSGGGGGDGRSAMTLYHCRGISDSCRTYLTWRLMVYPPVVPEALDQMTATVSESTLRQEVASAPEPRWLSAGCPARVTQDVRETGLPLRPSPL